METRAPGIAAPAGSVTMPVISPVWAGSDAVSAARAGMSQMERVIVRHHITAGATERRDLRFRGQGYSIGRRARVHDCTPNDRGPSIVSRYRTRADRAHRGTSDGPDGGRGARGVCDRDQLRDRCGTE